MRGPVTYVTCTCSAFIQARITSKGLLISREPGGPGWPMQLPGPISPWVHMGESLFTLFASLTYAYHYLMMLIE